MKAPVIYIKDFVKLPNEVFEVLSKQLDWEKRAETPRKEYYANELGFPYVYGKGRGVREYFPKEWHPEMLMLKKEVEDFLKTKFEICFLNLYENQKDHLGWHADDSPEMDNDRPIAIISLGVEREIWFRPKDDKNTVEKLKLKSGSLCVMSSGMQKTYFHRIPKSDSVCGERISLTFRGYRQ